MYQASKGFISGEGGAKVIKRRQFKNNNCIILRGCPGGEKRYWIRSLEEWVPVPALRIILFNSFQRPQFKPKSLTGLLWFIAQTGALLREKGGFVNICSKVTGIHRHWPGQTRKQSYPNPVLLASGRSSTRISSQGNFFLLVAYVGFYWVRDAVCCVHVCYLRFVGIMPLFLYCNLLMGKFRVKRRKPATWERDFDPDKVFWSLPNPPA